MNTNKSNKKRFTWLSFLMRLIGPPFSFRLSQSDLKNPDLLKSLEAAKLEWKQAQIYFNNVTDPDLIDHAIFYMGATEKKYVYLLKQARENGISVDGNLLN